jgi:hypothetical protein
MAAAAPRFLPVPAERPAVPVLPNGQRYRCSHCGYARRTWWRVRYGHSCLDRLIAAALWHKRHGGEMRDVLWPVQSARRDGAA